MHLIQGGRDSAVLGFEGRFKYFGAVSPKSCATGLNSKSLTCGDCQKACECCNLQDSHLIKPTGIRRLIVTSCPIESKPLDRYTHFC